MQDIRVFMALSAGKIIKAFLNLFDGTLKNVEDIKIGDQIMGPDSKPRNVLRLCRGRDRMIKIIPKKGDPFVINQGHILSLKRTRRTEEDSKAGKIVDIKFSDWEKQSNTLAFYP